MTLKPLNGERTHPLTPAAIAMLRQLARSGPLPCQDINPGMANRFEREQLVNMVMLPSPYKSHRGAAIRHYEISAAGLRRLD